MKNRLMFFVSNRFSFYAVLFVIAIFGGVTNMRVNAVRAEMDAIGQQSILYALATDQRMEFIEEYNEPDAVRASVATLQNRDRGVFVDTPSVSGDTLALLPSPGLLRADGAFAFASPTQGADSPSFIAPRTENVAYSVESGDTLSGIATKFGISIPTILWANNLTLKSLLKPGQTLTILPVSGVIHTVKSGDTLLAIAKKYTVDAATIAAFNRFPDNASLHVGDTFIIPGGVISAVIPRSAAPSAPVKDIFTAPPAGSGSSAKPAAGYAMVWPSDGTYIVRKLSWVHTGYDIDCDGHANGTSTDDNYAASDGVVTYAGARRGYGNTVEIDHGNGLMTRYGHFYSLYVKTGETVSAGDPLGRCGSTGNSTGTHLHFEVIDTATKKFLNPGNYIHS